MPSTPADFMEIARLPLEPEHCTLVVIDIQQKLLPPIFNKEQLLKNSQMLIRLAGLVEIPVLMTTQYSRSLGATVPQIASLLPRVTAIDKQLFSCFGSDEFCSSLKRLPGSRNTVLLCAWRATSVFCKRGFPHFGKDTWYTWLPTRLARVPSRIGELVWIVWEQRERSSLRLRPSRTNF